MGKMNNTWIVTAKSESGDEYGPYSYDHEPTEEDKIALIKSLGDDAGALGPWGDRGPGHYGSYVYLSVRRPLTPPVG